MKYRKMALTEGAQDMVINTQGVSKAAGRLRQVLLAVALLHVAILLFLVSAAFVDPAGLGDTLADWVGYEPATRALWQNVGLLAAACLGVVFWVVVFVLAARVFGQLAEGETDEAARHAGQLSTWFWAMLGWALISPMIISVVGTWHMPEGQRELSIALNSEQLTIALSALITACMARALTLGAELWRDHREMV
ncbi:MAG: hypothetical protein AAGL23_17950 [Pseudomonadota bacterium]